jgi:hypothetical protein
LVDDGAISLPVTPTVAAGDGDAMAMKHRVFSHRADKAK